MPLDPALASVLDLVNSSDAPSLAAGSPEQARAAFRTMTVELRDPATLAQVGEVSERAIDGPGGPIPLRIYRPGTDGPHPTVAFFHGGGFVIGDLDTHDDHTRLICHDVDAVVVAVDYALAPERPFPAGLQDCLAAYRWVVEHVAELGGDAGRLAVAGDSAGGNLSAAVALAARDEGWPLAAQLLLYPAVDFAEGDAYPSREQNAEGFFLTEADMRWFSEHYLRGDSSAVADPRASVLGASLEGAAPAVIGTAEFDPLRDEGEAYADALEKAGVQVIRHRYDGLIHGFFGLGHVSPACAAASAELCADLKALLG